MKRHQEIISKDENNDLCINNSKIANISLKSIQIFVMLVLILSSSITYPALAAEGFSLQDDDSPSPVSALIEIIKKFFNKNVNRDSGTIPLRAAPIKPLSANKTFFEFLRVLEFSAREFEARPDNEPYRRDFITFKEYCIL